MNKTEAEIYRDVLGDVSANFDSAETFTKQKIDEICDQNNISVEEVIFFFLFVKTYVFKVIACF